MTVDQIGAVVKKLKMVATERVVRNETDGVHHEVSRIAALLGGNGAHMPRLVPHVSADGLAKMALDSTLGKALVHESGELGIVVACKRRGGNVEDAHVLATALGSLGDLDADIPSAHHRDVFHGIVGNLTINLLALLEELEEIDAREVVAGQLGRNRERASCQHELVVLDRKVGTRARVAAHQVSVEINARDLGLHKNLGALGLKCVLVGIEELVDGIDLAAHPKRGTAAEIAQIGVTVDHHHFLIGIGVEQRVGGSDSGVVGSNDDGLHLIPLSRAGQRSLDVRGYSVARPYRKYVA